MAPIVSEQYRERKKQEIMESALRCFAKKGFESTSVDEICAQSGVSKGSIYTYFSSKDELYIELMTKQTEISVSRIQEVMLGLNTTFEKLDFLFSIYDQEYTEKSIGEIVVNLEFKLHSSRNKEINEKLSEMRQKYTVSYITEIIEEGQKIGDLNSNASAKIYAELFWTIMHGYFIQIVHNDYPYREMLQELKSMFYQRVKA